MLKNRKVCVGNLGFLTFLTFLTFNEEASYPKNSLA